MTQDIFTPVPEQTKAACTFGECELLIHDKIDKNGKPYKQVEFNILPVTGSKYTDVLNEKYGKFEWHSKPWDSNVLPSIIQLVNDGKITNAMELDKAWVAVEWREWLSDRYNDVSYWENRANDEENAGDGEKAQKSRSYIVVKDGKKYAKKRYLHFIDVFANETTCIAAYEERYGKIEQNAIDEVPGFEDEQKEPDVGNNSTAATFLAEFIFMAMADGKVNADTFAGFFGANELFKEKFTTIENETVQKAIAKANEGTGKDKLATWILEEMNLPF